MIQIPANIIQDYHKICDNIKELDSKIRFAGVINERGRLIAGGMREGIKSLTEQRQEETLYMELALRVRMRKEFDTQFGKVKFAMSSRQKALSMSFPINGNTLYVFADPNASYKDLPQKIIAIIPS